VARISIATAQRRAITRAGVGIDRIVEGIEIVFGIDRGTTTPSPPFAPRDRRRVVARVKYGGSPAEGP